MVTHMKTTIEIAQPILEDAKELGFRGKGLQAGVEEGSWAAVRDAIYEGRGA